MSVSLSKSIDGCCWYCMSSESELESVGVMAVGAVAVAIVVVAFAAVTATTAGKPRGSDHRFCVGDVRSGRDCSRFCFFIKDACRLASK